jgi:hypothetical protein
LSSDRVILTASYSLAMFWKILLLLAKGDRYT